MINIPVAFVRATYYIFCGRNRNWDSPDLVQLGFFFSFLFFFLSFFSFLNDPISGCICKLPIRSEIYNCTFKNTIKFLLLLNSYHYLDIGKP